ncbi:MAG: dienelactone hydrolase family protein [Gammaproteobacteria bacterium]
MTARWEHMKVDGREVRIYVSVPDHDRPRAGIVIAHHGPGLDAAMLDIVHRLTRAGYAAALPDLFHRIPAEVTDMMARIGRLRDDELVIDMRAAAAHLQSRSPRVGPLGVTGFCMGGRVTYLMAAADPQFEAAAVFYGGGMLARWGEQPSPFERSADIGRPLIGFFGVEDSNPSIDDVRRIDAELTRLSKWHEFHVYQGAGHAFMNFTNAERYRHRPAQAAWGELVAFFDEFLAPR